MLIQKTFTILLICFLSFGQTIAQQNPNITPKKNEIPAELKQKAIGLLRETIKELPNLKSASNSQFFMLESANLLWKYDQKEAQTMFESAMDRVRRKLNELKSESAKLDTKIKESNVQTANTMPKPTNTPIPSNIYAGNTGSPELYRETTEISQKYEPIMSLRRNIIEKLVEVEPQTSYKFLVETEKLLPGFLVNRYGGYEERRMKSRVVTVLAKKNTDMAIEIVRGMLTEGLGEEIFNMLSNIYEASPEKGSLLAEEILQKLPTIKLFDGKLSTLKRFLQMVVASKTQRDKKPLLSEKSTNVLANLLADTVISSKDKMLYNSDSYAKLVEKYTPEKATKIRLKFKKKPKTDYDNEYDSDYGVNSAVIAANKAVNAAAMAASAASNKRTGKTNKAKQEAIKAAELAQQQAKIVQQQKEEERKILLQKLQDGKFTAEEKIKVIEQLKKIALGDLSYADYGEYNIFGGGGRSFKSFNKDKQTGLFCKFKH